MHFSTDLKLSKSIWKQFSAQLKKTVNFRELFSELMHFKQVTISENLYNSVYFVVDDLQRTKRHKLKEIEGHLTEYLSLS